VLQHNLRGVDDQQTRGSEAAPVTMAGCARRPPVT